MPATLAIVTREPPMQRYAMIVGIKPEAIEEYERIHAEVWPEVLDNIRRHHMTNYSIFRLGNTLFGYYEYTGDDWAADMEDMKHDLKNQEWWAITDNMQFPVPEAKPGELWTFAPEVFHTD
jgi:L-rhamnose mutarotase